MKLLAIDGNSIMNRAYYGVKLLSTKQGVFTNAIFGFLNIYIKLLKDIKPDAVAVAFDVSAPTFRHVKYDFYKANRKGMPDELRMQMPIIKEILGLMGVTIVEKEGYEGDDVLGTLARICCENKDQCVIATGDRDCLQLVNECVSVSLAKTKENILFTPEMVMQEYGITPSQITDLKALMGDSSDNIPGVKGIGEKTALTLIKQCGSIENIYDNFESVEATVRVKKLLEDGKEDAFTSKELATINVNTPVDVNISDCAIKDYDNEMLAQRFIDLEMFSFLQKLGLTLNVEGQANPTNTIEVKTTVVTNPDHEIVVEECKKQGKIYFLYNDELFINVNNTIYHFDDNAMNALVEIVLKSKLDKYTFMAKSIYKIGNDNDISVSNIKFDVELAAYLLSPSTKGYVLTNLAQKYLYDTSYTVEEKYQDIAILPKLCDKLYQDLCNEQMLNLFEEIEMPLCEVLADMEYEGFGIDVSGVTEFGKMLESDIAALKQKLFELADEEFNPNSTKELGVILFEKLGLPTKKKTKTGYSTNVDVLESLMDKHEIIPVLMEYRKLTKLHSTYVVGLLKVIGKDKRVHSTFNQTETRTGRISSIDPNVQNIPVRTKLGSEIRKFFVARGGFTLIDADYSQIELRILAHISNDENMIKAFVNGEDIHTATASQVFKYPIDAVPSEFRSRAKAINFGIVYGIGAYSLSQDINVSVYEAKEYISEYLKTYNGVDTYMKNVVEKAKTDGYVQTLYGRKRDLADINSSNKMVQAFAQRVALNAPIQGTAADIIKIAMIRVFNRLKKEKLDARLILQVHDELIIEAPIMQADYVKKVLKEEMEQSAKLLVPLIVDVNVGQNWFIAKG